MFTIRSRARFGRRRGFTLLELIVVIAVVGVLTALLLPAVQKSRAAARAAKCLSNLSQIGRAIHQYHEVHQMLPQGRPPGGWRDASYDGQPVYMTGRSVHVALLPHLDAGALFEQFNFSYPWPNATPNYTVEVGRPGVFVCPADSGPSRLAGGRGAHVPLPDPPGGRWPIALTQYGPMFGIYSGGTGQYFWEHPEHDLDGVLNGCFNDLPGLRFVDVTDGLTQTVFFTERALGHVNDGSLKPVGRWTLSYGPDTLLFGSYPPNTMMSISNRDRRFGNVGMTASSYHSGGVHVLTGDGAVRLVSENIDSWPIDTERLHVPCIRPPCRVPPGVWQALCTRGGGELVGEF